MEKLRQLREAKNMSQQKLADQFALAQSQIHGYETNAYEPDIETLKNFAMFFETSVDYLIGNTDIPHKIEPVERYDLNRQEQNLINRFRRLPPKAREGIITIVSTVQEQLQHD